MRRLLKWIAVAVLILMASGTLYERFGEWQHRTHFPPPGQLVDIGGRSLHLYCSGEGAPSVILEAGGGEPGLSWVLVQPEVAAFTRACWYDRAGFGWSDLASDRHWSVSIATDLHKLLRAAGVPPPYVLVGHSVGGFHVRVYNGLYADDVAGMVLVDSPHEDTGERIPDMPRSTVPKIPRRPAYLLAVFPARLGVFRLIGGLMGGTPGPAPEGISSDQWTTIWNLRRQPKAQLGVFQQGPLGANVDAVRAAGDLGNRAQIVLTAGRPIRVSDPAATARGAAIQRTWIDLHGELAQLSTRGRHIVVENSGHMMPYDALGTVISAVRDVVEEIRTKGKRLEPTAGFSCDRDNTDRRRPLRLSRGR